MMVVIRPGLWTTVQDAGRRGYQRFGVSVGGALDSVSMAVANALVGNPEDAPVLEVTFSGPTLHFQRSAALAVCGGEVALTVRASSGSSPAHPPLLAFAQASGRLFLVGADTILEMSALRSGARAYLAVAGGWDVPRVLGSASTLARAGLGGYQGRALQAGDRLAWGTPAPALARWLEELPAPAAVAASWCVSPGWWQGVLALGQPEVVVRALPGPQADWLTPASERLFWQQAFQVLPASDRMGCRLRGPRLALRAVQEMVSEPVCAGVVQVPPDGQPIVLQADGQTTGGYPKLAYVVRADWPRLAQLRPGQWLRFVPVAWPEAQAAWHSLRRSVQTLAWACQARLAGGWPTGAHVNLTPFHGR
ncbi:MAG: biotin-dependent carboxyltransferase family protein [Alicyclobacillus sp.]|nr:biotin-dependent carboxyltransferase family protein [Alicyclobacillus sp.]